MDLKLTLQILEKNMQIPKLLWHDFTVQIPTIVRHLLSFTQVTYFCVYVSNSARNVPYISICMILFLFLGFYLLFFTEVTIHIGSRVPML